MTNWYELGPFTVYDVETTGMSPSRDRIVEISAVRINLDNTRSEYSTLVNPLMPIPKFSTRIHNISDDMVHQSPHFGTVGKEFTDFAMGSTLVAHNARFDLGFLQESLNREILPLWEGKTLDTLPLVKQAYPGLETYKLQSLREVFHLSDDVGPAHRAYADVAWTVEMLEITLTALMNNTR